MRAKLPEGMSLESEETTFEFKPDGTATAATITLYNDKDDRVTVKIDATTGRVFIENEEE